MSRKRVRLHTIHRDPRWQIRGLYAYYECRCGARRTRHVTLNLMGPVEPGWPEPVDRHGQSVLDTGWRKPKPRW